jgi:hypothetical protein
MNNHLQEKMDAAFENYFHVSKILREDMIALIGSEVATQHWRRNFIRSGAALLEGEAHCLREICVISSQCTAPNLTRKESAVLQSEDKFDANDRVKLTLRSAYRLFELDPTPDFGDKDWLLGQRVFEKRHLLMHPKTSADLEIPDYLWDELHSGMNWLMKPVVSQR